MNRNLRKAIYNKKMFYHKYLKNKKSRTWEKYRQSRNLVNKIKKQSINKYFQDRCIGGCKSANFWSTIKPYLFKKGGNSQNKIILKFFNSYFVNLADGIGKDYVFNPSDHPSLKMIDDKQFEKDAFDFKPKTKKLSKK